tara:strand:+ start:468 stop:953 length:486 start_codon:yes stop_codon:yes gene_type:complete
MVEWRRAAGYSSYEVSSTGLVRSYRRSDMPKLLRQDTVSGYKRVVIVSDEGASDKVLVHRLVASTFLGGHFKGAVVNHKDKDRANNTIDNLEWCTVQYNVEHSHAKTYLVTCPKGTDVVIHNMTKYCREVGLHQGHMVAVSLGKAKQHMGYRVSRLQEASG